MIKFLVTSFYNTLIDEEDAIPTSTMFAFDKLKAKNIKLVILTNRLEDEVIYYNHDYPFIDYIISLNGSRILNVSTNKAKDLKSFTKEEVEEITNKYQTKEIIYYTKNSSYDYIPEESIYKIEIKGIKKNIDSKYETSILNRNKEYFLEITKNNFLDALKLIADPKEILGVIGNESDEVLLKNCKNIYVVRNAPKCLKEQTENITKSNKHKGVETVIKSILK